MVKSQDIFREFFGGATRGKASNVFIEDDKAYSYGKHFPIGHIDRKRKIVWVNKDKYSSSTSKQQSWFRREIPTNYKVMNSDTDKLIGMGSNRRIGKARKRVI